MCLQSGYHPGDRAMTFLSCCLKGLEQTRSYNPDVAHLILAALLLAVVGMVASGAAAVWVRAAR
jgi:hypothetical protein